MGPSLCIFPIAHMSFIFLCLPSKCTHSCPHVGPNPLSRQLRERLVELEIEIERFKEENAKVAHLKQQREAGLEALR